MGTKLENDFKDAFYQLTFYVNINGQCDIIQNLGTKVIKEFAPSTVLSARITGLQPQ